MFGFSMPQVPSVNAEDAHASLEKKEQCVFLDVRTKGEFDRGHIEGAVHVPVESVGEAASSQITDKKTKIYVYCLSGSRSVLAVDTMQKMGFTNVFDMKSGLLAWRAKGYTLVTV